MNTNGTTSSYELSNHTAWMLIRGIKSYIRESKIPGELSSLELHAAKLETEKLLKWAKEFDPQRLTLTIKHLNEMMDELDSLIDKSNKKEFVKSRKKDVN